MKHLKIGFSVLFILLVSFFVVRACVHPKRAPTSETTRYEIPLFSKLVQPGRPIVMAPRPGLKAGPRVAIILDDWGKNHALLKKAVEIGRPLTLAVIPGLLHSKQIAKEAHQNGLGVMLHLPMEPFNRYEPLEPHTIMTSMREAEIKKIVDEAIAAIPFAEGANNHMGSVATSDARVMKAILSRLKSKKLFFIDSQVVATTKGLQVARETKIRFAERDVFIDNENNVVAIKKQLEKAIRIALTHGEAIVIGHDRKFTLQAIKEMLPAFDQAGVKFVFARDVVKKVS